MQNSISNPSSVLFVDDEVQVLNSLRRELHRLRKGWDVSFETDAVTAVQSVIESPPDVVVTDLNMPAMTGIEMVLEMRESVPPSTVFILLTGAGDLQSAIAAINHAHIFRFLTKPCPAEALSRAIDDGLVWKQSQTREGRSGCREIADATLDRLSAAVVVVDRTCRVVHFNDSASDIITAKSGLLIDAGGVCRAAGSGRTQTLHDLVREASFLDGKEARFLKLPTSDDRRDLHVAVQAISNEHVALFLADPERARLPSLDGLQELFGLTKAEAAVARTLAAGGSLEDASAAGGITVSSARTYLKRVFSKTNVARQSELVHLVLTTPMPLQTTVQPE